MSDERMLRIMTSGGSVEREAGREFAIAAVKSGQSDWWAKQGFGKLSRMFGVEVASGIREALDMAEKAKQWEIALNE